MTNNDEHDSRVMVLVASALQQPLDQRKSFLQRACPDDAQLCQEVIDTVEWEERMGNFLLEPMVVFEDFERPFRPREIVAERFEIVREIGEGGMGVVYEAHDRKRNQRIAIKSAKIGFRRWLTPELESALKVRHQNICLVNEIHTTSTAHGDVDFLTMEFLDGQSLSAALSAGIKFGHQEALEIARQLCAGLSEAHRSRIIHRDLKSANIILCNPAEGESRVVITDFGLAGAAMTGGELAGTPRYMAPELWRGEKASKASDIYALGVVLYEMVAGRPPYEDEQEPPDRDVVRHPAPPSTWIKGLDRRWDAAILACLNPSPSGRPQDATEVLAILQRQPFRKTPLIAVTLLAIAGLTPAVRQPLLDYLRPAKVRLAILPAAGPEDTAPISSGILQSAGERIKRLRSGGVLVAVKSSEDVLNANIHTIEQARDGLQATHVLQVTFHRDGAELAVKASVIEVATQAHLQELTARYAPEIAGDIPRALAGAVSAGLRLRSDAVAAGISAAARAPYDRAQYFLQRDLDSADQALPLFKEASLLDPHSPLPLAGEVEAQVLKFYGTKLQHYLDDARLTLHQAESLDPDSVSVHLAAGLLNQTNGQYGKALEDYQRVQEIDPRNLDALLRSAGVYDAQNLLDKAIENCQKAIQSDPGSPKPYQHLGAFYYRRGKYLQAAEQFQKAIDRDHGLADAYTNLGAVMSDMGREAEAEKAFLTSLKIREAARSLNGLGAIRDNQARDAEAAGYYRRAVTIEPGNTVYWLNLGNSEYRQGHLVEAQAAFRKVKDLALVELQQNPHRGYIRAFVAYAKLRLGDYAGAEEEISQALHSSAGNGQVVQVAVLIYDALGKRDRAIDILSGSTPDVLGEIDRDRDLADFRQDLRFRQLMAKPQDGRH
ncbi:MAG TPA: protein kinase [Candidatus Saccharimonadales bacterium]|jgi:tetratricopeptide (TPR) repeat protein|nr:protein kinase [Candidatus Saccharimonadales bacterium]